MPFAATRVQRALTGKLGFAEDRSGPHPVYERWHDGLLVGVTHMSHGRGDVGDFVISSMARQLGVRGPDFRGAIQCSISSADFLALLLAP
jgi:hypothetical protein